jgi:hypothetical protein
MFQHRSVVLETFMGSNQLFLFIALPSQRRCSGTSTIQRMQGYLPPLCRAHSATLVGRKIVIIGGGGGSRASYYNSVYVFNIPLRRWLPVTFTATFVPLRARHGALPEQTLGVRR